MGEQAEASSSQQRSAPPPPPGYSWTALLADRLQDQYSKGAEVFVPTDEALLGKHVALYFSAHWCPPCRGFTPALANTYNKLKKDGRDWEVVFVSMDRNPAQFQEYFSTMPWLAVPFRDDQLRSVLTRKFNVQGIPQLVMLAPDGSVLCSNARGAVQQDPNGEHFPWEGEAQESRGFSIPWILLAFLVWWVLNTYFFPPKPKQAAAGQQ